MKHNKKAFTLVELLVVVLIIGILAAIALPMYQVTVKKAFLTKYMPLVRALYNAEEIYYATNGNYTNDLTVLDIQAPQGNCTYKQNLPREGFYQCGTGTNEIRYGVWDGPVNAQAGDTTIRYVMYFAPTNIFSLSISKGDIVCFYNGSIARHACRSLGEGIDYQRDSQSGWSYYKLIK